MPILIGVIIVVGWLVWLCPFFLVKRGGGQGGATIDRRARWGLLLQCIAFGLVWQPRFREAAPGIWRVAMAIAAFAVAAWLSWTSARTLGAQWRVDAGLNAEHQLVRTGAYAIVRHPIYASMFGMLLGTGLLLIPWPLLLIAALFFIAGAEIRVRIEERLLSSRFGAAFATYRRDVPAYIPFLTIGRHRKRG